MTTHAHYSKAQLFGHPIHPMIVGFPIAFYTGGVVTLILYATLRDPFWYRVSMVALLSGTALALLAAIFGTIDLFLGVPRRTSARKTGVKHFGLNLLTTVLFAGAGFMLYYDWHRPIEAELRFIPALVLGCVGLVLTFASGALGWKLVQTHHVGIDEANPEEPPRGT